MRRHRRKRPERYALLAWICVLSICGCSSGRTHSASSTTLCKTSARRIIAHTLGLRPDRISTVQSIGNNAMPQCSFRASEPGRARFELTVNVDTSPQPYMVLSRKIVEGQQVFTPTRLTPAPIAVMGLGLLASWFPAESQLMSTDGVRMITTSVTWSGVSQLRERQLATRISRLYLGKSKPSLAKLYP